MMKRECRFSDGRVQFWEDNSLVASLDAEWLKSGAHQGGEMKFQFMVTVDVRDDSPEAAIARQGGRGDMELHFGLLLARCVIADSPGSSSNVDAIDVMDSDVHDEVFIRPKSARSWFARLIRFELALPLYLVVALLLQLVGGAACIWFVFKMGWAK